MAPRTMPMILDLDVLEPDISVAGSGELTEAGRAEDEVDLETLDPSGSLVDVGGGELDIGDGAGNGTAAGADGGVVEMLAKYKWPLLAAGAGLAVLAYTRRGK